MHFVLKPEVAGGLGATTEIDSTIHPPLVTKLEYQFEGWLGDDLLESFPCFIVTEHLRHALEQAAMSGYQFGDVTITTSPEFDELEKLYYPARVLPQFCWLQVYGVAGKDDFGITSGGDLCVSSVALDLLRQFSIEHCLIAAYSP